jgi:putative intracellular protease/amidase
MKQYLESLVLQQKISDFWALKRPVGAICHGVLLLARCKDSKGNSLLHERKTTTLPKYMENLGYYITRLKHGELYRTYEVIHHFVGLIRQLHCEDEVKHFLKDPVIQFTVGL